MDMIEENNLPPCNRYSMYMLCQCYKHHVQNNGWGRQPLFVQSIQGGEGEQMGGRGDWELD